MGHRKANAAFVILVRNHEVEQTVESLQQIEDRFNKKYGYNYVFLNEVPFTEQFIKYVSPHTCFQAVALIQMLIKLDLSCDLD